MPFDHQPTLIGDLLILRPLQRRDFQALFAVASDPLIWQQHPASNRHEESVFRAFFDESLQSGGALIAIEKPTQAVVGSSRYHGYDESASEIEIGWTFLARAYWGGLSPTRDGRWLVATSNPLLARRFVGTMPLLGLFPPTYCCQLPPVKN